MVQTSVDGQQPDSNTQKNTIDPRVEAEMGILFREIALPNFVRPIFRPFELTEAQNDFQTLRAEELDRREKKDTASPQSGTPENKKAFEPESPKPSLHGTWNAIREVAKLGREISPALCAASLAISALASSHGLVVGTAIKEISDALYSKTPDPGAASLWGIVLLGMSAIAFFSQTVSGKLQDKFGWKLFAHLEGKFLAANAQREFGKLNDEEVTRNLRELKENRYRLQDFFWQTLSGVGAGISFVAATCVLGKEYSLLAAAYFSVALLPRLATEFFSSHLVDYFERSQMRKWQILESKKEALTATPEIRDMQVMHSVEWGLTQAKNGMAALMARRFQLIDQTFCRRLAANSPVIVGGLVMFSGLVESALSKQISSAELAQGSGAIIGAVLSGLALTGAWGGLLAQSGYAKRILGTINGIKLKLSTEHDGKAPTKSALIDEPSALDIEGLEIANHGDPGRLYRLRVEKLVINAGDFIGIVGKRGAGKSTLLKTMLKEVEPEKGNITLSFSNGTTRSLQDLKPADWHHHVNCLYQDAPKFNGLCVRDAICLGHAVGMDDIWKIMTVTGLSEITAAEINHSTGSAQQQNYDPKILSRFLDTRIGADMRGGRDFSGGEMRLIALTRTLLHPQPIVILDEPGESLDPETERGMIQRVRNFCSSGGRTLIVVSHRYGTLIDADKILVLDNGEIRNSGSHKQLLSLEGRRTSPVYAEGYTAQLKSLLPGFNVSLAEDGSVRVSELLS
jgi:ABC-type multidrug transport system fused ATPase/permease subunit